MIKPSAGIRGFGTILIGTHHVRESSFSVNRRIETIALALCTALCAAVLALPVPARAQTLGTDIICGKTADKRGIATADLPDITAEHALVVGENGTVYYERDADAAVKIASITKVMTAVITLENTKPTDTLTVDKEAADIMGSSADLQEGDTLTVEQALRGLMIPSGNDAALALAKFVGKKIDPDTKDPVKTFVAAMNKKAKELGLKDTLYENPHGLDLDEWKGDLHSTARDVEKVFAYAMKNETFRKTVNFSDSNITVTGADGTERTYAMQTHNPLLGQDGNIGGKTGTTDDAGFCFVSAYEIDGNRVYIVVLHSDTNDHRYSDTAALARWYVGHQKSLSPFNTDKTTIDKQPLIARASLADWSDKTVAVTAKSPSATVDVFTLEGDVTETFSYDELTGDVRKGDTVGTVTVKQGGKKLRSFKLVAAESVPGPTLVDRVLVGIDRIFRFFEGEPSAAPTVQIAKAEPKDAA